MSLLLKNIQIPVEEGLEPQILRKYVAQTLGVTAGEIADVEIRKKSLDARKKNGIKYVMQLEARSRTRNHF